MGYKGGFRFSSYKPNKIPTHVYNFVFDNSGKKITFDACVESLKESPRYTYIKDMEVTYLAGSPIMVDSFDYLGRRKRGKGGRGGRGGRGGLKKLGLAPARGAFLLMVKFNARGLATKLQQSIQKGSDKTKAFWEKVGGNFDKLKAEINKGAKKKPLLGIKKKGISGATSVEYLEPGVGAVDPATLSAIAAAVAAAAPILLAVSKLFKSQRIPEGDGDVITDDEKEGEPGLDPDGTGFTVTDAEPGSGSKETPGMLTTGFKPSPLIIGAIGLGALGLLYILTKKKR
jgi:hypothetical protein